MIKSPQYIINKLIDVFRDRPLSFFKKLTFKYIKSNNLSKIKTYSENKRPGFISTIKSIFYKKNAEDMLHHDKLNHSNDDDNDNDLSNNIFDAVIQEDIKKNNDINLSSDKYTQVNIDEPVENIFVKKSKMLNESKMFHPSKKIEIETLENIQYQTSEHDNNHIKMSDTQVVFDDLDNDLSRTLLHNNPLPTPEEYIESVDNLNKINDSGEELSDKKQLDSKSNSKDRQSILKKGSLLSQLDSNISNQYSSSVIDKSTSFEETKSYKRSFRQSKIIKPE